MKTMHRNDVPFISREKMVEIDRLMTEEYGISLIQMMENAGRNLAELVQYLLGGTLSGQSIAVVCGGGNNGGGGMAAARHLSNRGAHVSVALSTTGAPVREAPAAQFHILRRMQIEGGYSFPAGPFDLVVDAMIGYGLRGSPRGKVAEWIERLNTMQCPVLSVDIPSGMDADSGQGTDVCVKATATLALALPKKGMAAARAKPYLGRLFIGDISVPRSAFEAIGIQAPILFSEGALVELSA